MVAKQKRKKKRQTTAGKKPRVRPSSTVEPAVDEFLGNLGLPGQWVREAFWTHLEKAHGPIAYQLGKIIEDRSSGRSADIYPVKNSSLQLCLDFTSQYSGDLHREYLSWFGREGFEAPKNILDLGCDIGVTTCFYGVLYPNAEVLGVDQCSEAIARAREIASNLGVDNVSFIQTDISDPGTDLARQKFDLVTATTVFHEVLKSFGDFPDEGYWTPDDLSTPTFTPDQIAVMHQVEKWINPEGGKLVAAERLASFPRLNWWIHLIETGFLRVDLDRSYQVLFRDSDGDEETIPIVVASGNTEKKVATPSDIWAFYSYPSFERKVDSLNYEGPVAESLFESMNPKDYVVGCEATYHDQSGSERLEIWTTGGLALFYRYTNGGFRELSIRSSNVVSELSAQVEEFASARTDTAAVKRFGPDHGKR